MTNFTNQELRDRTAWQQRCTNTRLGYKEFLTNCGASVFVTLSINQGAKSLDLLQQKLAKWVYYMDGAYNKKTRRISNLDHSKRLRGWFIPEKRDTNAHWHGLVTLPRGILPTQWRLLQFRTIANYIWKNDVPSGDVLIEPIFKPQGVAGYCLKESFRGDDFYGSLISLSDFWPASKPERTR